MNIDVAQQLYLHATEIGQQLDLTTEHVRQVLSQESQILARYPSKPWGKVDTIITGVLVALLIACKILEKQGKGE